MLKRKSTDGHGFDTGPWVLLIASIFFFSILRGIRFPNIWSYCHFLFNYDSGFTKRGLLGSVAGLFDSSFLISYEFFMLFSVALFLVNVILLNRLMRNLLKSGNMALLGSSLVFASSLAVVFLSHSIGYFDHIGLLITLVALNTDGFYRKLLFVIPAMTFALLTHEAILAIFYPVIFMSLLFSMGAEGRLKQQVALGVGSVLLVVLALFIGGSTLQPSETDAMYGELQNDIHHPLREDAFHVLQRDASANLRVMGMRWSNAPRIIRLLESLLVTMPVCVLFIFLTLRFLRAASLPPGIKVASVLASLSPLLLHAVAWDMHRWNTLAVTTSFLMLYVVHKLAPDQKPMLVSRTLGAILVAMIFLNGISAIDLFDGYYVKQFPFAEHQQYIVHLLSGKEVFPYIPVR